MGDPKCPSDGAQESALPDVSATSLADLFASDETALAAAVRGVVRDVERSAQAISGWASYVDTPDDGATA